MLIVTLLSLGVAAYFIYREYSNTALIKALKAELEDLLNRKVADK